MRKDEYDEMHEYDEYEGEKICCMCSADYDRLYYFDGKWWCGDCLEDNFCIGDAEEDDIHEECAYCGEPITGKVYQIADDEFYCEECFYNNLVSEE